MTIYLYCLTDAASGPAGDLRGMGGEPVRAVPGAGGRAAAWVSDLPTGIGPATAELARVHDRVVRAALAGETPLPARLGQTFAGEDALRRALEARADGIAHALERVRGGVEMTIRVLLPPSGMDARRGSAPGSLHGAPGGEGEGVAGGVVEGVAAGGSSPGEPLGGVDGGRGRAYMARLRDRQHAAAAIRKQAEFLQARVAHVVDGVAREEVCSPFKSGAHSFSVSHLVAREAVRQYRLAVDSLVAGDPTLRLLVSGPWAPYSFARIAGG